MAAVAPGRAVRPRRSSAPRLQYARQPAGIGLHPEFGCQATALGVELLALDQPIPQNGQRLEEMEHLALQPTLLDRLDEPPLREVDDTLAGQHQRCEQKVAAGQQQQNHGAEDQSRDAESKKTRAARAFA